MKKKLTLTEEVFKMKKMMGLLNEGELYNEYMDEEKDPFADPEPGSSKYDPDMEVPDFIKNQPEMGDEPTGIDTVEFGQWLRQNGYTHLSGDKYTKRNEDGIYTEAELEKMFADESYEERGADYDAEQMDIRGHEGNPEQGLYETEDEGGSYFANEWKKKATARGESGDMNEEDVLEGKRRNKVAGNVGEMKGLYQKAKEAKVGEEVKCPSCKTNFVKSSYQQAFCKTKPGSVCKDRYWNSVTPEKRNNQTRISPANAAWRSRPPGSYEDDGLIYYQGSWGYFDEDADGRMYFVDVMDTTGEHPNDQGDAGDKGSFFN